MITTLNLCLLLTGLCCLYLVLSLSGMWKTVKRYVKSAPDLYLLAMVCLYASVWLTVLLAR